MWLGGTGFVTDMVFAVPEGAVVKDCDRRKASRLGYIGNYTRLGNSCWFTNIEHGRRHQPLALMTMADNIKFSRHKDISFLDKYCPEQFAIIGQTQGDSGKELGLKPFDRELKKLNPSLRDGQLYYMENGIPVKPYARILIRKKQ